MAEWVAGTPWWVWLIVPLAAGGLLFRVGMWVGAVNTDRESFKDFTRAVRDDIQELQRDIKTLLRRRGSPTISSGSPLRLTKIGKRISEALNVPVTAETLALSLKPRVSGKLPYDVQEFCFEYIRDEYTPSAEDEYKIKNCAYENGLDRDDVLDVLAIMLLEEREELLIGQNSSDRS